MRKSHRALVARLGYSLLWAFKSVDNILDHCCCAWNAPIDPPWKIMSIDRRDWAVVGQPIRGLV